MIRAQALRRFGTVSLPNQFLREGFPKHSLVDPLISVHQCSYHVAREGSELEIGKSNTHDASAPHSNDVFAIWEHAACNNDQRRRAQKFRPNSSTSLSQSHSFLSRRARFTSSMWSIARAVQAKQSPNSRLKDFFNLWQEYQSLYTDPSPTVLSAVCVAYHCIQSHRLALELYYTYPKLKLQHKAYECLLKSAQSLGDIDAATNILNDMERHGYALGRSHYEQLLSACVAAGDEAKADRVMATLAEMPGEVSPHLYRSMLRHHIDQEDFQSAAACFEALKNRNELQPRFDSMSCERFVYACLNNHEESGVIAAFEFMKHMKSTFDIGLTHWILHACAAHGFVNGAQEAFHMLTESPESGGYGIIPQEHHFAALILARARALDWQGAYELLGGMSSQGVKPTRHTVERVVETFTLVLSSHMRPEHIPTYLLHAVKENHVTAPCTVTANVLLWTIARSPVPSLVEELVECLFGPSGVTDSDSVAQGVGPDQLTYEILLEAYSQYRMPNYKACRQVIDSMQQAGFELTAFVYQSLAQAYCFSDQPTEAVEILKQSVHAGQPVSRAVFEEVGRACARLDDRESVNIILQLMEAVGHAYTRRFLGYLRRARDGLMYDYSSVPSDRMKREKQWTKLETSNMCASSEEVGSNKSDDDDEYVRLQR